MLTCAMLPDKDSIDDMEWLQTEQTEPLNLSKDSPLIVTNNSKNNDDDVIFVQQYEEEQNSYVKRPILTEKRTRKVIVKDRAPRRNPVRQARNSKRFKDFTSSTWSDEDINSNQFDNETLTASQIDLRKELRPPLEKGEVETVKLNEIESLVFDNLIEMKNLVRNMKTARIINGKLDENEWKQQCQQVIGIVKYQAILLGLVKGVTNVEVLKFWNN